MKRLSIEPECHVVDIMEEVANEVDTNTCKEVADIDGQFIRAREFREKSMIAVDVALRPFEMVSNIIIIMLLLNSCITFLCAWNLQVDEQNFVKCKIWGL